MRTLAPIGLAAWLAVGCTPPDDDGTFTHDFSSVPTNGTPPDGTPTGEPTVTTIPDGLSGTAPDQALPPPSFSEVVARNGTPALPADLVGKPTVLWFYPAAFTGG